MSDTIKLKQSSIPCYFAASNSGHGFVSYFDKIFSDSKLDSIYIIKGGPGTGKSSLMKQLAKQALALGYSAEAILCSSDPDSYDGVIINKATSRIAILDGTFPHTREPQFPGAVDEIIDLGQYWDRNALRKRRNKIILYNKKKSDCYKLAYGILSCASRYSEQKRALVYGCINRDKLSKTVNRILSQKKQKSSEYYEEFKLRSAISSEGIINLDVYKSNLGTHIAVTGAHHAAFAVFDEIKMSAISKKLPVILSPTPLCPEIYDAIAIPSLDMNFYESAKEVPFDSDRVINSERFLDQRSLREIKPTLRLLSRLETEAVDSAIKILAQAKNHHLELESIYSSAMDFDRLGQKKKELEKAILL